MSNTPWPKGRRIHGALRAVGGGFENSLLIDYEQSTPLVDGPNARGFHESFVTPNCPTTDPLYVYIENGHVPAPASQRHRRANLPNPGGKWRWDNDEGWMSPGYRFIGVDQLFLGKTLEFLGRHQEDSPEQPFLCVLATQVAHAPVLPAEEYTGSTEAGPRGDFVAELDGIVGRLLAELEELGIAEETLVVFHADNGPETVHTAWMRQDHDHDAAGGLRGMKRDGWEGGHRVPLIARWPGRIPAGQVSPQLICTTDLLATMASLVGHELAPEDAVDSFDMLPALAGTETPIRPHLLTQSFRGEFQLRVGSWKYLDHPGSGGNNYDNDLLVPYRQPERAPEAPGQLYELVQDPGETRNLYLDEPERREQMQALLSRLKAREGGRTAPLARPPRGLQALPALPR